METLQEFKPDLTIEYKPGKTNVADPFSRRPDLMLGAISAIIVDQTLKQRLAEAYEKDPIFLATAKKNVAYTLRNGIWFHIGSNGNETIALPNDRELQHLVLQECHDNPLGGHFGVDKTTDRVRRSYHWLGMDRLIRAYIRTCDSCQRNKPSLQKPGGLLQPFPNPNEPWERVSLDFITKLPTTINGNDTILVVVDMLSKMAHFISTTEKSTAEDVAKLFFDHIVRHHGLPKTIVSDRDTRFTGKFWQALFKSIGTNLNLSTSFHPQTDGQTERMNRTLEESLRSYVMPHHRDWDQHLIPIEIAYNDSVHASTRETPYFLNSGRHPLLPHQLQRILTAGVPRAHDFIHNLRESLDRAKKHLNKAKASQKTYADRKRQELTFKVGDYVRLSNENLPQYDMPTKKLAALFTSPLRIVAKISDVAYRLKLPDSYNIHDVFHVSLLRPYNDPDNVFPGRKRQQSTPDVDANEKEYEVEAIVDHRDLSSGDREFLVKWKNYPLFNNSWEPMINFRRATKILRGLRNHPRGNCRGARGEAHA